MQVNPVNKSAIFTKFLKYTKTSDITFCANMPQYSHYATCLQEGSTHFRLRASIYFGLEVTGQSNMQKSQAKNQQSSQNFFELTQLFMNSFLYQTVSKSSFYILPKLLTYYLTNSILFQYPPQLLISDLAYINCTILRSKLKCRKMLKCVILSTFSVKI